MKKRVSLLLCAAMIGTILVGCGSSSTEQASSDEATTTSSSEEAVTFNYPEEPIELVVPRAAGGLSDLIARVVANSMKTEFDDTAVVVNIEGGDGLIGSNEALAAEPDGYTLLVVGGTEIPNILANFDGATFTADEIVPICQLASKANIIITEPDSQFETLEDLISYAKENPNKVTIGIAGSNAQPAVEEIMALLGIELTIVKADGGNATYLEVLGGHVDLAFLGETYYENAEVENLNVLVETANRTESVDGRADTFLSKGYDYIYQTYTYIAAPADTPEDIIRYISDSIGVLDQTESYQQAMLDAGSSSVYIGYDDFKPYFEQDLADSIAELLAAE